MLQCGVDRNPFLFGKRLTVPPIGEQTGIIPWDHWAPSLEGAEDRGRCDALPVVHSMRGEGQGLHQGEVFSRLAVAFGAYACSGCLLCIRTPQLQAPATRNILSFGERGVPR